MHSVVDLLLQMSLYLFFSKFKTNLLAENYSIIHANTWFADVEKSYKIAVINYNTSVINK